MEMAFTIKVLQKHAKITESLLNSIDCDYAFTGTALEQCGTTTHGWFVSRGISSEYIGIEDALEDLSVPYDRTTHGASFKPLQHRSFRLDEHQKGHTLQCDHGDNTIALLEELEDAIAGNDYAFVRNFIKKKRLTYLRHLAWDTQDEHTAALDVA